MIAVCDPVKCCGLTGTRGIRRADNVLEEDSEDPLICHEDQLVLI